MAESILPAEAGGKVAATILAIGEVWASASALGPSVFTIRSPFFHEQAAKRGNIGSIRFAEAGVVVLGTLIGGATSYLVRSPWPLAGSILAAGIQVGAWEWAIAHPVGEGEREQHKALQRLMVRTPWEQARAA